MAATRMIRQDARIVALLVVGLAMIMPPGCKGGGDSVGVTPGDVEPERPQEERTLLVGFTFGYLFGPGWELEVYTDGLCRAITTSEGIMGIFET